LNTPRVTAALANQSGQLRTILQIFIDAVKAGGEVGAPGGVLYSAVMDKMSLGQFEQIMSALVQTGKVRKSGHVYHWLADL
jgi:hypothetical protein